ncbi:MAG: plastocyanin/azurin family copper-binding protein [Thermoprotei archaeon]
MKTALIVGLALIVAALVIPIFIMAQQYGTPYPFNLQGMMQGYNQQWMKPSYSPNPVYPQSYNNMWNMMQGMMQGMHGQYGGQKMFRTITQDQLNTLKSKIPNYVTIIKENNTIIVNSLNAEILVLAGPEEHMYAFEIYGLINPTIIIKQGTQLKITVINVDEDMPHSFSIITLPPPYPQQMHMMHINLAFPGATTPMPMMGLPPAQNNLYPIWIIETTASMPGTYYYICAVPQHAAAGMYGTIIVK